MKKMTILLQKTACNATIIDWNGKDYQWSENLKHRAFL